MTGSPKAAILQDPVDASTEKLRLEIKKLELESATLAKPWFKTGPAWLGISALAVSVGANVVQFSGAERARQLAEIRKERLALEADQLETTKKALKVDADLLETKKQALNEDLLAQSASLDDLKRDLDDHRGRLSKLLTDIQQAKSSRTEILVQVQEVRRSADRLASETKRQPNPSYVPEGRGVRDLTHEDKLRPGFYVQLGKLVQRRETFSLQASVNGSGAFHFGSAQMSTPTGEPLYRVLMGPYSTSAKAEEIRKSVAAQTNNDTSIWQK